MPVHHLDRVVTGEGQAARQAVLLDKGAQAVGDPTQGAQTGDRVLSASASEVVCIQVSLPLSDSTGQGLTTTATLNFIAEQTANN